MKTKRKEWFFQKLSKIYPELSAITGMENRITRVDSAHNSKIANHENDTKTYELITLSLKKFPDLYSFQFINIKPSATEPNIATTFSQINGIIVGGIRDSGLGFSTVSTSSVWTFDMIYQILSIILEPTYWKNLQTLK